MGAPRIIFVGYYEDSVILVKEKTNKIVEQNREHRNTLHISLTKEQEPSGEIIVFFNNWY